MPENCKAVTSTNIGANLVGDLWLPRYGSWSEKIFNLRMEDVQSRFECPDEVIEQSSVFGERKFAEWEGRTPLEPAGYLFLVPLRLTRSSSRYMSELSCFLPVLEYLDSATAQVLASSLSPFAGCLTNGRNGLRGAIWCTQVYSDMAFDLGGLSGAIKTSRSIVDSVVARASKSSDLRIVGLGAALPSITKFGTALNTEVPTTTGHGCTVALMVRMVIDALHSTSTQLSLIHISEPTRPY